MAVRLMLALFVILCAGSARGEDWSQWRGPRRDGVADFKPPKAWPKSLKKEWQITVGQGHSSPIVAGDRVYVFARQDDDEVLLAINLADGKQLFRHAYAAPYKVNSAAEGHGKGPKSTPVLAGERLVTLGISGILTGWDVSGTGKRLWQHEFSRQFAATSPLYGTAMSPLIRDGQCLVHVGGHGGGALASFALADGRKQWTGTDEGPAYASPVLAKIGGAEQLITQTQDACLAVDPRSGKTLWKLAFSTEYTQNSVTPLVVDDRIIFGGYNQPTFEVRPIQDGGVWRTATDWKNADIPMYMSSPVALGKRFFGMTQRQSGQLFCAEVATGKVLWTGKPRLGENAALVLAGDVLFALTNGGNLVAVSAAADTYRELARYRVSDSPTWAHPVLAQGKVLIKNENELLLLSFE